MTCSQAAPCPTCHTQLRGPRWRRGCGFCWGWSTTFLPPWVVEVVAKSRFQLASSWVPVPTRNNGARRADLCGPQGPLRSAWFQRIARSTSCSTTPKGRSRGIKVIIAGAGGSPFAGHVRRQDRAAGAGCAVQSKALECLDSLLSIADACGHPCRHPGDWPQVRLMQSWPPRFGHHGQGLGQALASSAPTRPPRSSTTSPFKLP